MFSEIKFHFKQPIGPLSFFQDVPTTGSVAEAIANSRFANSPEIGKDLIFSCLKGTSVILAFPDGNNGLELSVENRLENDSLIKLKDSTKWAYQLVLDQAKAKGLRPDKVLVGIHSEESLIQTAQPVTFWRYLRRNFIEKILSVFLVSLFTSFVGMVTSPDLKVGLFVFLATVLALAVRVGIEALGYRGEIEYVEK